MGMHGFDGEHDRTTFEFVFVSRARILLKTLLHKSFQREDVFQSVVIAKEACRLTTPYKILR